MVVVRGINVFPTMVSEIINKICNLSGEYRITLNSPPPYHRLLLDVELDKHHGELVASDDLIRKVEENIKTPIGVQSDVILLPPDSLPRTEGKSRRIIKRY